MNVFWCFNTLKSARKVLKILLNYKIIYNIITNFF